MKARELLGASCCRASPPVQLSLTIEVSLGFQVVDSKKKETAHKTVDHKTSAHSNIILIQGETEEKRAEVS